MFKYHLTALFYFLISETGEDLQSAMLDDESSQDTLSFVDIKTERLSPAEQLEVSSIGEFLFKITLWRLRLFENLPFPSLSPRRYFTKIYKTIYIFLEA